MALLSRLFNTFNIDGTRSRNHKVTQFVPLKLEINGHMENIDIVVIDLKWNRHVVRIQLVDQAQSRS